MLHKAWNSKGEMPYRFPRSSVKFQGHMVQNITDFDPNWAFPDYRPVAAFKSLRFALFGFHLEKKSIILLAFFPYFAQIIISIGGCVTCNNLWPWPIFSRSFGLDLENHVLSVPSTVLDGFFQYLVQMITSMRCVACDDLWPWPISSRSFDLDFENRVRSGGYPRLWHRLIYLVDV